MKKIITCIFFILFVSISAQQALALSNFGGRLATDHSPFSVNSAASNRSLSYDEIEGSPYYDKSFSLAHFIPDNNNVETALARYNSYTDEIEFKKDDQIFSLISNTHFKRIELTKTKETIVKLDTNDDLRGYFFEIVNGKNSLYKKLKTKFNDFVPAPNSYASDKPATFKSLEPAYYIKTEKGFIKKPKNQKEVIEQLPDKKDALNNFFKSNKIKFDKEEDLKKLVTFLNQ